VLLFRKQAQKLELMQALSKHREIERELLDSQKVQNIMERSMKRKEAALNKIEKKKVKAMRDQEKKRENVEGKLRRHDIIEDFANYSSSLYAPKTREGRKKEAFILQDIKPPSLATLGGIESLEKRLAKLVRSPYDIYNTTTVSELSVKPTTSSQSKSCVIVVCLLQDG
jgi:cell fate (sporulation/competence/biofilm development) regulator YmcA (YheA/YmcA/DUF963 family)